MYTPSDNMSQYRTAHHSSGGTRMNAHSRTVVADASSALAAAAAASALLANGGGRTPTNANKDGANILSLSVVGVGICRSNNPTPPLPIRSSTPLRHSSGYSSSDSTLSLDSHDDDAELVYAANSDARMHRVPVSPLQLRAGAPMPHKMYGLGTPKSGASSVRSGSRVENSGENSALTSPHIGPEMTTSSVSSAPSVAMHMQGKSINYAPSVMHIPASFSPMSPIPPLDPFDRESFAPASPPADPSAVQPRHHRSGSGSHPPALSMVPALNLPRSAATSALTAASLLALSSSHADDAPLAAAAGIAAAALLSSLSISSSSTRPYTFSQESSAFSSARSMNHSTSTSQVGSSDNGINSGRSMTSYDALSNSSSTTSLKLGDNSASNSAQSTQR